MEIELAGPRAPGQSQGEADVRRGHRLVCPTGNLFFYWGWPVACGISCVGEVKVRCWERVTDRADDRDVRSPGTP